MSRYVVVRLISQRLGLNEREKRKKRGEKKGKREKKHFQMPYLNDAILSLRRPEIETS